MEHQRGRPVDAHRRVRWQQRQRLPLRHLRPDEHKGHRRHGGLHVDPVHQGRRQQLVQLVQLHVHEHDVREHQEHRHVRTIGLQHRLLPPGRGQLGVQEHLLRAHLPAHRRDLVVVPGRWRRDVDVRSEHTVQELQPAGLRGVGLRWQRLPLLQLRVHGHDPGWSISGCEVQRLPEPHGVRGMLLPRC